MTGARPGRHAELVALESVGTEQLADILAARQRDFARARPGVSRRFTDASAAAALIASSPAELGIAARDTDGRLLGWLSGSASGTFGFFSSAQHAIVDSWPDPTGLYGHMYAVLATEWRSDGVTVHDIEIPAIPALEQAWFDLGFGRRTCFAARFTGDPFAAGSRNVRVRVAQEEDLDTIARIALVEAEFRNKPPLFAQQGELRLDDFRSAHMEFFRSGAVHFLARLDGRDVGLLTLERESPAPLLTEDDAPFIGPTAVDPQVRGAGIGHALVAAVVKWCQDVGAQWVGVSFNTPNLLSRPFWLGCGFEPTGWKLARRLPSL